MFELIVYFIYLLSQFTSELLIVAFTLFAVEVIILNLKDLTTQRQNISNKAIIITYGVVGMFLGFTSTYIFPEHMITITWLRYANILAAPLLCGYLLLMFRAKKMGKFAALYNPTIFSCGLVFSLAIVLMRLSFTHPVLLNTQHL